jgi:hypothetical protein
MVNPLFVNGSKRFGKHQDSSDEEEEWRRDLPNQRVQTAMRKEQGFNYFVQYIFGKYVVSAIQVFRLNFGLERKKFAKVSKVLPKKIPVMPMEKQQQDLYIFPN